ncbi:hypothetical protein HPB47_016330 [Ixodes persulcatus]|uniref:Uncharacterized protein n=1 Tax=Ixodes persulcatus TaxID=34615 RepID=A0AC60QR70_IXOPE|nr:hypothetical protein HPB47_016330 [Ixodes persulcatus]
MDADHVTSRLIMWKFPAHSLPTAIIEDSQVKYVHHYFDPADQHSPAFISQPRASIFDAKHLDFVPRSVTRLILHLGTNDPATTRVSSTLARGLRGLCHQERDTYFLDHCLDQLPRRLTMAADGLHQSFSGVSYLAWNVHRLFA